MVDNNLINTFETIMRFDNFSRCSNMLEHEFKDRSLKSFISSLKHYKSRDKKNFIEEFYKKYPYQIEEKEIVDDNNEKILKYINGSKDKMDIRKQLIISISKRNKLKLENKKFRESEIPDSLRYSPNYNAIYKKIPSFKIGIGKTEISLNSKRGRNQINDLKNIKKTKINNNSNDEKKPQEDKTKLFKTNININNIKDKNNKSKNNIFLNLPPIIFKGKNYDSKNNNNNMNKKYNTIEYENSVNNSSNPNKYHKKNLNCITENNKKSYGNNFPNKILLYKNIIDFKKMSSRNDKYLIYSYSLDVPSSEKYSPKYEFIEDNVKNIKFSPFGDHKKDKKFLLKQIFSSYKVPTEYQLIDNEKLLNDKDLINKQLILNYNINPYQ